MKKKETIRFKENNIKDPELSIESFTRVKLLFEKKQWLDKDPLGYEVFNNFCRMLAPLNEEQYELLMSLSKNFIVIHEADYLPIFGETFDLVVNDINDKANTIVICPLLAPYDFDRVKSSRFLYYLVKSHYMSVKIKYADINIVLIENPKTIKADYIKPGTVLCLIDDFIGTGETAENAVEFFLEKGISRESIRIVSLAGMYEGIERLIESDIRVFVKEICRKGISDSNELSSKRSIMKSIENRIHVEDEYRFGYGASEGLVKMVNTPNNTFPIYWLQNEYNTPPFPRGVR